MRATTLTLFDPAFLAQVATPSITPALFNPVRWYDSSSFVSPNDEDLVITWDDSSPSDDDATANAGKEPTIRTNIINGLPVVRFGPVKHLRFSPGGYLVLGEFTILCVGISAFDSTILSAEGILFPAIRTNHQNQPRASWHSGVSGSEVISNLFASNAADGRMIGYRRRVSGLVHFFDNLTLVSPASGDGQTAAFGINQIGTIDVDRGLNIDIAELLIFNTALTDDEIRLLYNEYFKPKYALP